MEPIDSEFFGGELKCLSNPKKNDQNQSNLNL